MAHVALATCPTRACHKHCQANFFINQPLESMPFWVSHIQIELIPRCELHAESSI